MLVPVAMNPKFILPAACTLLLGGTLCAEPPQPVKPMPGALQPFTPDADTRGEWAVKENPDLPKVLILGDSISIGYTLAVRKLLHGKANVWRPMRPNGRAPDNCGDTTIGLARLDEWLTDRKWDVIHFNWGLWDLCYRNPEFREQGNRDKVNGTLSTTPEDYERNLEKLVARMKATGAQLVWASTTLVPEGEPGRFTGDDATYNAIAKRVMDRHSIPINDLHAVSRGFSAGDFVKPGDVHFTGQGSRKLADQVAAKISELLENPPTAAD
jgi:lysophospholipase L1-like esterase